MCLQKIQDALSLTTRVNNSALIFSVIVGTGSRLMGHILRSLNGLYINNSVFDNLGINSLDYHLPVYVATV